jgi:protein-glutamine gamma-glutamyltransferase
MKLAAASSRDVTYPQLKAMSACLAMAMATHVAVLPAWLTAVVLACVVARLLLAARGYAAPARPLRLGIAGAAVLILFLQLRTFNGLAAGGALLTLVAGLKILETQTRRDLFVVALIVYFLSLAALLRSESFWLLAYLACVSWATTTALLHLSPTFSHSAFRYPAWREAFRYTARISAQALPLALVFWLFFPRFEGPLWNLPNDRSSATTGLSDSMDPGDIAELALSDEVAFRVHFAGPAPPPAERYWRGPVLHDFDGRSWRGSMGAPQTPAALRPLGTAYEYTLSLEPHRFNWIFALDWPDRWNLADAHLTADYTLVQADPVARPINVAATSHTHVESALPLGAADRRRDTWLPPGRNRRTAALASELRRAHPNDADFVGAVLEMFRDQQFFYTLDPPRLGFDPVDEFLFETKRGFCGHYASAFAVLARSAGIPARVVTGYQGGIYNRYANYYILHQSNAHAWDEVWLEGRGWVRVDPTSAVSPTRVDQSLEGALAGERAANALESIGWIGDLRLRLDALGELWRERILRFDEASQDSLLERFGIEQPDTQKIVAVMAAAIVLAFAWLMWQVRREQRPAPRDPLVRAYGRLCAKLAAAGLPRHAHEGAEAYAARISLERPDLADSASRLLRLYSELRYGASFPASGYAQGAVEAYVAEIRAFRILSPRGS